MIERSQLQELPIKDGSAAELIVWHYNQPEWLQSTEKTETSIVV